MIDSQTRRSPAATGLQRTNNIGGRIDSSLLSGRAEGRPAVYIGSPIDNLMMRLEGVQRTDKGCRAQCPSCGGKGRKLSLCEGDAGIVLLHCFGCGDAPGVLAALGLSLADLYPTRIKDTTPEGRRAAQAAFKQSAWGAALGVLATESTVIEVAAEMIGRGEALGADGIDRVHLASQRIHDAKEVLQ